MNNEMKSILGKFCFSSIVICCIAVFAIGTLTAKQKADYTMFYKQYPVFSMKTTDEKIEMSIDEKIFTLELGQIKALGEYYEYLYYTPLSVVAFFISSVTNIIHQEKT